MRSFIGLLILALIALTVHWLFREDAPTSSPTGSGRGSRPEAANFEVPQPATPPADSSTPAPARSERAAVPAADGGRTKLELTDLPRAEGARIEGRVIDRGGRPVSGAQVRLLSSDGAFLRVDRDLGLTMPSDGEGRFAFADPPAQVGLALEATAPQFASLRREIGVLAPGQIFGPVELIVEPEITLRGGVKDAEGRPLADVRLELALGDPQPGELAAAIATTSTDDRGAYRVSGLRRVLYRVLAEKPGYVPLEQQKTLFAVTLKPEATLDFVLEPATGVVKGRVLDDRNAPLAAATVTAVAERHIVRATSGAGGEFELTGLGRLPYRTTVEAPGFHGSEVRSVQRGENDVVLRVARNGSVHGTLALAGGAAPDAAVDVLRRDRESGNFTLVERATYASAAFHADDLTPGHYKLVITSLQARRTESAVFEIVSGEATDLGKVELLRGGTVSGRIEAEGSSNEGTLALLIGDLDAANPAAQGAALFSEETQRARYRAGVSFRIEHVAPGDYSLLVLPDKGVPSTVRGLHVDDDRTTPLDAVKLGAGGRVFGRVLDVQGVSIGRAVVRATHENGTVSTCVSDRDGYFSFPALEPGAVIVALEPSSEVRGAARPVTATATAGSSVEIELRVRPEGP